MAKTYNFRFSAQRAEFRDGMVSAEYGGDSNLGYEAKMCTLAEALAYLPEFSDKHPAPHTAFLGMQYRGDRRPPGFTKARKRIDREV